MECKNCGTENEESAVYCKNCGTRLDGKIKCFSCGTLNQPDAVFCVGCGIRIDGKKVCPECGALSDGKFCQACGALLDAPVAPVQKPQETTETASVVVPDQPKPETKPEPVPEVKPEPKPEIKTENRFGNVYYVKEPYALWQKILRIVGNSFAMLAITLAFSYMFLSGLKTTINGEENPTVIYYLSTIYTDVDKIIQNGADYINSAPLIIQELIATAIYTTMLIVVLVNWIICLINFIKTTKHGCEYTVLRKSAQTVCFYVLANALVLSVYYKFIRFGGEEQALTFNSATDAGIALSSVCILISVLCIAASEWKKNNVAHNIVKYVTTACGITIAAVLLSLLCTNGVGTKNGDDVYVVNGFAAVYSTTTDLNVFLTIVGTAFNVVAVCYFGAIVDSFVDGIEDTVEKRVIVNSAVCFGFLATANTFLNVACLDSEASPVNALTCSILGAVMLAVAITTFVLRRKFPIKPRKRAETTAENTAENA
ncbi:MAG: zinc ribbon domain-containing protein [Candidatus Neoclostridium sp.]